MARCFTTSTVIRNFRDFSTWRQGEVFIVQEQTSEDVKYHGRSQQDRDQDLSKSRDLGLIQ